jgi:hypothetical protein
MKRLTKGSLGRVVTATVLALGMIAVGGLLGAAGSGVAASSAAPSETAPPTISGTPADNQTLTADPGTWSSSTTVTYAYQWARCDAVGGGCSDLSGETSQTYKVTSHDVGHTLRVRVTATNADGSESDTSAPTAVATAALSKPSETSPPTISGTPQDNSTLGANPGKWNGSAPITFGYQWRTCDKNGGGCSDIQGATNQWYAVTSHDVGHTLRVHVTAKNDAGTASDTSVPTAVVSAAPPTQPASGCPSGTGAVNVSQLSPPARLTIDRFQVVPSTLGRNTSSLSLRFHVSACGGRSVAGALVYATAIPWSQFSTPPEAQTGTDGWASEVMTRGPYYPVSPRQQLLAMFLRARKAGENVLGGISTRRLVSFPVSLG